MGCHKGSERCVGEHLGCCVVLLGYATYTLGDLVIVIAHVENRYETNIFLIRTNGLCCSSLVGVGDPVQANHKDKSDGKCRYPPAARK